MSKQTCKTILGLCVVLIRTAIPGAAGAKKFAGEFMSLGGGARALGMGGAFAAVADDASTLYWNPAGISGFEKRQALFMHSETFGDLLNYNFAAFVAPTSAFGSADREASFGFALVHLGVDDILITKDLPFEERNGIPGFQGGEDRLLYDVDALPKEGSNDFALFGSFAMNTDAGRLGGTLKLIYSDQVAGYSATGIGVDVGYLRRDVLTGGFDVGVKVQDLTGTYIGWSTGTVEFIAPSVKLGLAYRIAAPTLNASFVVCRRRRLLLRGQKAGLAVLGRRVERGPPHGRRDNVPGESDGPRGNGRRLGKLHGRSRTANRDGGARLRVSQVRGRLLRRVTPRIRAGRFLRVREVSARGGANGDIDGRGASSPTSSARPARPRGRSLIFSTCRSKPRGRPPRR